MFDLDDQLRRWRQETEATLAFEPEEIDELEDHLKFAVEKAITEGAPPEQAWRTAIARVGASPSLALEFAKSKLMPALFHLMTSWSKPVVLLLMFILWECYLGSEPVPHTTNATFWILTWLCFVTLFILLPSQSSKLAYLFGVGNAFSLIPLLPLFVYNQIGDRIVGPGWSGMGASFGPLPITFGVVGLAVINTWAWQRSRTRRSELPRILAVAAVIVLVLAVSPFLSELIGNLSVRDIYHMPTASDITLTGDAKSDFLKWKFVEVLFDCVVTIATWLPLALLFLASLGTLLIQALLRYLRPAQPLSEKAFPAANDLPWFMTLATSGLCWVMASSVEPNLNQQILEIEKSAHGVFGNHIGYSLIILSSTLVFLFCSYEMTQRLRRAASLRFFYASMIIAVEGAVLFGVMVFSPAIALVYAMNDPAAHRIVHSAQPVWLWWMTVIAGLTLALHQSWLVWKKTRATESQVSLWKFDGGNLVQFGTLLGLIGACSTLILMMVALVLAFESTAMISAMIDWGNSIKNPATSHFDPTDYVSPPAMVKQAHYPLPHLDFWIFAALAHVAVCLTAGIVIAMALSGLEFIRFNIFRLYRARKAGRMLPSTLALNE